MDEVLQMIARLNDFVKNIDAHMVAVGNAVSDQIVALQTDQLLNNKGNDDKFLVHSSTKSEFLSKPYARFKSKALGATHTKQNIYFNGNYQAGLSLNVIDRENYEMKNEHWLDEHLPKNYPQMKGIAPSNRQKAYAITTPKLLELFNNKVLNI